MDRSQLKYEDFYKARTKQMVTSDQWEIKIINKPSSLYWMGEDAFKSQIFSITGLEEANWTVSTIKTEIGGGFEHIQVGNENKFENKEITFSFVEYASQEIMLMVQDATYTAYNPLTRTGARNSDIMWDFDIIRRDTNGRDIRVYECRGMILKGNPVADETMSNDRDLLNEGKVEVVWEGQVFPAKALNI